MKHRSVGAFALLAAIFLAVPQASRDLLDATSDLGSRARSCVLQALVGLHAGGVTIASARPSSAPLAAGPAAQVEATRSARKAVRNAAGAQSPIGAADAARTEEPLELAMILDPASEGAAAPRPPLEQEFGILDFGHAPDSLAKSLNGLTELAMIIPPDAAIPGLGVARAGGRTKVDVTRTEAFRKLSKAALQTSARYTDEVALLGAGIEQLRRSAEEEVTRAGEAEAADVQARKVFKTRRDVKKVPSAFNCGAPQFVRDPACAPPPAPATPVLYTSLSE